MATLIQILQHTLEQKDPLLPNETKRIVLKEVLQVYVLDFLYNHPTYRRLNFYGGTCLHIVYGLNRLSEDIDLDNSAEIPLADFSSDLLAYIQKNWSYAEATAKTQHGEMGILRITLRLPILNALRLSPNPGEALHLKVEISQHKQVAEVLKTPVFVNGRSFVPVHFSLETMMAGKIIACLERNFQHGRSGALIKGRDFYDLLWFMQRNVQPLKEKLVKDGKTPYTTEKAMQSLAEKVRTIKAADLAVDLYPLFEQRTFTEAWLEGFHQNFTIFLNNYLPSPPIPDKPFSAK
jgi:predicted nucleotidyltransferase component of viral defense system